VISYGLWQQLSGGDEAFVGRTLELNGAVFEVVGVLPPDFRYPREAQVWLPFRLTAQWQQPQMRNSMFMETVVRLRPGVNEAQLAQHLEAEVGRWNETYPGAQGKVLHAVGFVEHLAGPLRLILLVLMGAVVFVLLIAALNVGSLQLVRAAGRSREIAVRSALGAGRGRLVRQLLLESTILGVLGGAVGLWLGVLALDAFSAWGPAQQMHLTGVRLDRTVLAFTATVSLAAAVAFGTLPALRATRVEPQDVLRGASRGSSAGRERQRLLQGSVVVQVALALLLLLGSGLMLRTLSSLFATHPGFDPRNVLTAQVSIPGAVYDTPEQALGFFDALLERTRALGGVQHAALVWGLPFSDQTDSSPFDIPARPSQPGEPERHHEAKVVSDGYFATMRIPLLRGRDFDGTEQAVHPTVAIIDETFAEQFFPGEDPVGQQITGYTGALTTIIGVAARVDHRQIGDAPKASAYYSVRQQPWVAWRSIAVRSDLPQAALTTRLREAVASIDPNVPLYDIQAMEARIARSAGPHRLALLAFSAFAALSVLLATLGVYGVMRYSTTQRTREIGIRMAIGARPGDVVRLVLRQGAALTVLGLALGSMAALWLTQLMAGMLFGVSPRDPAAFLGAIVLLAGVALFSSWLPAWRAARIDPLRALHSE
jgi:putative ABC transport system permease protein